MKTLRIIVLCGLIALGPSLAACGGGGSRVQSQQTTKTTTLGQELMDLEEAYKNGVITEDEYKKAKEKLLEENE